MEKQLAFQGNCGFIGFESCGCAYAQTSGAAIGIVQSGCQRWQSGAALVKTSCKDADMARVAKGDRKSVVYMGMSRSEMLSLPQLNQANGKRIKAKTWYSRSLFIAVREMR